MARQEYPFSGMDMLQNGMAQLVGELKNVSAAISESARSISTTGLQQSAYLSSQSQSINNTMVHGAARVMAPMSGGGGFFKETFSRQFNKPSLWSRDLIASAGLRDYEDMYKHEAKTYANRNLGYRAEMAGLNIGRFGGSIAAGMLAGGFFPAVAAGIAVDATVGNVITNRKQQNDWMGYLDNIGRNNALLGRGGTGKGWNEGQMNDMSKWLSTQDKTWYNRGIMKHDDLQTTVKSLEMSGYFFDTPNTEDMKRKLMKGVNDTKEVMKVLKMFNDEAGKLVGEMQFFGYKDPTKTIKEMNQTAAMTGLSFSDVKSFGMEYARTNRSAYFTDKDTSTELAMDILQKYTKKEIGGAQAEMGAVNRAITSPAMQMATMKYDAKSGTWSLDEAAMNRLATADPMQLMDAVSAAHARLTASLNGDSGAIGMAMMQMNAIAPSIMQGASQGTLQRFALGQNLSTIKTILSSLGGKDGSYARAIKMGGDDPFGFLNYISDQHRQMTASILSQKNGTTVEQEMQMLKANSPDEGIQTQYGPKTLDDIPAYDRKVGGWLGLFSKHESDQNLPTTWAKDRAWTYQELLTGRSDSWAVRGDPNLRLEPSGVKSIGNVFGDHKYKSLRTAATLSVEGQIMGMYAMNNKMFAKELEITGDKLKELTGYGGWDSPGDAEDSLIMGLSVMGSRMTNSQAEYVMQQNYADYGQRVGKRSEISAQNWAKEQYDIRAIQNVLNDPNAADPMQWRDKLSKYSKMGGGTLFGNQNILLGKRGSIEQLEWMGLKAAYNTGSQARKVMESARANNSFDSKTFSPTLMLDNAYLWSKTEPLENYESEILAAYESTKKSTWSQLTSKDKKGVTYFDNKKAAEAEKLFNKAINAKTAPKLQDAIEDYSKLFMRSGGDISMLSANLAEVRSKNIYGDSLPELHIQNVALSQLTASNTIMGELINTKYSGIFASGAMNSIYSQLSNSNSALYQKAKSGKGGAEEVAKYMTDTAADIARRSGRPLNQAGLRDISERSLATIEAAVNGGKGSADGMRDAYREILSQQTGVEARVRESNSHLMEMEKSLSTLAGVVEGPALRISAGTLLSSKNKTQASHGVNK